MPKGCIIELRNGENMTRNERSNNLVITLSTLLGIALILLIIMGIANINKSNQLSSIQSKYDNLTSSTAQQQQSCIKQAQDQYQLGSGLTDNAALNLSTSVNACKAEFPTK